MFIKGQKVTQILPDAITGVVDSFAVDQETGELQILVNWQDVDGGDDHHRYFKQSELVATAE